jgi:hypothetical protein
MPPAERIAYVLGARGELARLVFGPPQQYASTIAEAISVVVRRLRERPGSYRLYVLSDMVQITPAQGGYNFAKTLPAPKDFVAYLKKQNLTPDLHGIAVLACGIHSGQSGPNSAARVARLQEIWRVVFQSMGADAKIFSSCEAAFAA